MRASLVFGGATMVVVVVLWWFFHLIDCSGAHGGLWWQPLVCLRWWYYPLSCDSGFRSDGGGVGDGDHKCGGGDTLFS